MYYVVYSGKPAGEIYDREVAIVKAASEDDAIAMCEFGEMIEGSHNEWLWGPHAKLFDNADEKKALAEAIDFAVYRATSDIGQVYSGIAAYGFGKQYTNDAIAKLVFELAQEKENQHRFSE